jgi:hypothetical protein
VYFWLLAHNNQLRLALQDIPYVGQLSDFGLWNYQAESYDRVTPLRIVTADWRTEQNQYIFLVISRPERAFRQL